MFPLHLNQGKLKLYWYSRFWEITSQLYDSLEEGFGTKYCVENTVESFISFKKLLKKLPEFNFAVFNFVHNLYY